MIIIIMIIINNNNNNNKNSKYVVGVCLCKVVSHCMRGSLDLVSSLARRCFHDKNTGGSAT